MHLPRGKRLTPPPSQQDCLKDLRSRLVDMANIIQARFEHETDDLRKMQAGYKANQGSLTKEKEAKYISDCNDAMFRIHILEQRLNRYTVYRIAGKCGGDLNLAEWRIWKASAKFNAANFLISS